MQHYNSGKPEQGFVDIAVPGVKIPHMIKHGVITIIEESIRMEWDCLESILEFAVGRMISGIDENLYLKMPGKLRKELLDIIRDTGLDGIEGTEKGNLHVGFSPTKVRMT
jgi:hypothetical protein